MATSVHLTLTPQSAFFLAIFAGLSQSLSVCLSGVYIIYYIYVYMYNILFCPLVMGQCRTHLMTSKGLQLQFMGLSDLSSAKWSKT